MKVKISLYITHEFSKFNQMMLNLDTRLRCPEVGIMPEFLLP